MKLIYPDSLGFKYYNVQCERGSKTRREYVAIIVDIATPRIQPLRAYNAKFIKYIL